MTTIASRSAASLAPSRVVLRPARRRWVQYAIIFCTVALIVNALIGERGVTQLMRARRDSAALNASLAALRHRNAVLRDEVARLKADPTAIEEAARRDLGLARPGEILFIVRDVEKAGDR